MLRMLARHRAMALFLSADFLVFLALFGFYVYRRIQSLSWPTQFHFASGLIAVALTLFAFSGSVAMHYAARHQTERSFEVAMRLTVATVAVWTAVFIMIAMEWVRLIAILEITFGSSGFSITYFTLTGFYILHILVGLVYLSVVASRIEKSDAEAAMLYVHYTNLIWLILFAGIYLTSTDLQGI